MGADPDDEDEADPTPSEAREEDVREDDEELARPRELVFIMGSAPLEDGSAEARVYDLRRRTGL